MVDIAAIRNYMEQTQEKSTGKVLFEMSGFVTELCDEVERLRGALRRIEGPCVWDADGNVVQCANCGLSRCNPQHHKDCAYRIAQEALAS